MKFNVVLDKWVPVLKNGELFKVSPIDIFTNEYDSFAGDPVENYCILKFFITLAQSSKQNQPNDVREWWELRNTYHENVLKYIETNSELFEMFGDKPFLQCNEIVGESQVLRLREIFCDGNNAVLFSQQTKFSNTIEQIVIDLIVHQNFSVTFGRSFPLPKSYVYKNSPNGNLNFYATLENIKDTIWYNLFYGENFGQPVWEVGFDQTKVNEFLNQTFPLTTRIKILDNLKEMKYGIGLTYPECVQNSFFSIVEENYKTAKEQRPLSLKDGFKFWNDFTVVISKNNPPNCLMNSKIKSVDAINLNIVGAKLDSNSGYMYTDYIKAGTYEIKSPEKILTPDYISMYSDIVKETNSVIQWFNYAIKSSVERLKKENHKTYMKYKTEKIYEEYVNPITNKLYELIDVNTNILFTYTGTINDKIDWRLKLKEYVRTAISILIKREELILYHTVVTSESYLKIINTLNSKD